MQLGALNDLTELNDVTHANCTKEDCPNDFCAAKMRFQNRGSHC